MKSVIALEYLILEVLEKELAGTDQFLSESQIAYRANGLSYEKKIERDTPISGSSVKLRMPRVREIADGKGMTIIAHRIKDQEANSKNLKVLGWKIAGEQDTDYIHNELEIRKQLSNGNYANFNKIAKTAVRKGLLEDASIPKLTER